MNRVLLPPQKIVMDLRFELLGLGVERIIDQEFGAAAARPSERPSTDKGLPPILIADFAGGPDGDEPRIAHLLARTHGFRLLVLMLVPWDDVAIRFVRAGAKGILYPSTTTGELIEAVYAVAGRHTYLPAILRDALAHRYVTNADGPVETLTRRELEFARGLSIGVTTSELAGALNIGLKTAETHRANVLRKLGVRNNVELARLALRHGLVGL